MDASNFPRKSNQCYVILYKLARRKLGRCKIYANKTEYFLMNRHEVANTITILSLFRLANSIFQDFIKHFHSNSIHTTICNTNGHVLAKSHWKLEANRPNLFLLSLQLFWYIFIIIRAPVPFAADEWIIGIAMHNRLLHKFWNPFVVAVYPSSVNSSFLYQTSIPWLLYPSFTLAAAL